MKIPNQRRKIALPKKKLLVLVCLVAAVMALCSCQVSTDRGNQPIVTTASTENTQETAKQSNQTTDPSAVFSWEEIYLEIMF
jgi:hypothetical protein